MNFPVFLNKFIIGNRYLRYRPVWYWYRLINHDNWRLDDNIRYWDFWNSVNQGILDMNYKWVFETYWGKDSYPPERTVLSQKDFDALTERLNQPPDPEVMERLKEILNRKAPWDDDYGN